MSAEPLVIVGDSMLDVDLDGSATRLSPEAPVPVVDAERVWHRPGGAGLAALLAARTDPDVVLVTGLAEDAAGRRLDELLAAAGVRVVPVAVAGTTIVKTRIRARGQSVLRLDRGTATPRAVPVPTEVAELLGSARAVCVADYGAGMTALAGLRGLLAGVATRTPVVWDPHPRGSAPVPHCALVTPNDAEAQRLCGRHTGNVGAALRRRWQATAVCITLGARGAHVYTHDASTFVGAPELVAAPRVHTDVCGAGDRFAVAAAEALGAGADPVSAVVTAVTDATRFVTTGGAAAVSTAAALDVVESATGTVTFDDAAAADAVGYAARLRRGGSTVVATGGCFDLLHTGHIKLLRQARQLGDALIVLVNSDRSVRALKGPGRPVMAAADRARVLAALACVDAVAVFDDLTPQRLLESLRPDFWVKGGDYSVNELPEAEVVRRHGGEVVIVPTVAGYSSSRLIAAARSESRTAERY